MSRPARRVAAASRRGRAVLLLAAALFVALVAAPTPTRARYAAIVVHEASGHVLFSRNADQQLYPASLTKLMTLYLTFEALAEGELTLDQELTVSRRAAGQTPSKLGLRRGATIRVEDALLALVTKSANDVATVLAETLGDTEVNFAIKMTKKARALGMTHTTFRNASGLPNRGQRSSARDMANLALALIGHFPDYYAYFATRSFSYRGQTYENHNQLLTRYAGTDGLKTGYIRASGFNLVASVRRGPDRLVGVVFGGRTARTRDSHMIDLFQRGFNRLAELRAHHRLVAAPLPIPNPRRAVAIAARRAEEARAVTQSWGVQVGAFVDKRAARRRVAEAVRTSPRLLDPAAALIERVRGAKDDLYRARVMGLSEPEARTACEILVASNIGCVVVVPDGTRTISEARQRS